MDNASVKTVTVGTAVAAPGTVVRGAIPVTTLGGGTALEIPVVIINGTKPGKVFWVDGAIHGDEPEGPLCCQHLLAEVKPEELSGTLVLVPVINVPAFEAASRGNPLDTFSYDMNRIYPGRANGYLSERVAAAHAKWLTEVADIEISIHSGGSHSYLHYAIFCDESPEAVAMSKAMGPKWGCIMSAVNPKGNPMAVLQDVGKVGLTVELGGRSATSPSAFAEVGRELADAALNIMRHYKMLPGEAKYPTNATKGSHEALLAPHSGIFLAEPTTKFGSMMKKGDPIGRIVTIFGDELSQIVAPADGMIFGLRCLPNVTTGDWCCFYNKVEGPRP